MNSVRCPGTGQGRTLGLGGSGDLNKDRGRCSLVEVLASHVRGTYRFMKSQVKSPASVVLVGLFRRKSHFNVKGMVGYQPMLEGYRNGAPEHSSASRIRGRIG